MSRPALTTLPAEKYADTFGEMVMWLSEPPMARPPTLVPCVCASASGEASAETWMSPVTLTDPLPTYARAVGDAVAADSFFWPENRPPPAALETALAKADALVSICRELVVPATLPSRWAVVVPVAAAVLLTAPTATTP